MSTRKDHSATWLQARGWRQGYHSTWTHDTLSPHGALATDQAVRAQTQADRALSALPTSGIIQAIEKADAAGATNTSGALSHQPESPGGEHV